MSWDDVAGDCEGDEPQGMGLIDGCKCEERVCDGVFVY